MDHPQFHILHQLLSYLECPVCRDLPQPPLVNCENGHFVCSNCLPHLPSNPQRKCPTCFANLTTRSRNFPLESLLLAKAFSCPYGCGQTNLSLLQLDSHECLAKFWRPGRVIKTLVTAPQTCSRTMKGSDEENLQPSLQKLCRKCNTGNRKEKVKCVACQSPLRPPTPMMIKIKRTS